MRESENALPKQFLFGATIPKGLPKAWIFDKYLDLEFARSPDLPLSVLLVGECVAGVVLGWFVFRGRWVNHGLNVIEIGPDELVEEFERTACGRFILITTVQGVPKVRMDCSGLLPCVFDSELNCFAASPAVIGLLRTIEHDEEVVEGAARRDGKVWYPFGLVPFKSIHRLLPDQSWNLGPRFAEEFRLGAPRGRHALHWDSAVEEILNSASEVVKTVGAHGPFEAHLTAGRDSRMLAGVCIRAATCPTFVTYAAPGARRDCATAAEICSSLGLQHKLVRVIEMSDLERQRWFARTGECLKDSVMELSATVSHSFTGRTVFTGMCGEIARSFYWKPGDLDRIGISSEELVSRLGFDRTPILLKLADEWISLHDNLHVYQLLDAAYIELRLACWGGPSVYGHDIPFPTISPFNRRDIVVAMQSLCPVRRYEQMFAADLIRLCDPRLLSFKFNSNGFFGSTRNFIRRVIPASIRRLAK